MQNNIKMTIPGGLDKQSGFTLIELVMVIVILGILSAFAIPRFADLSGQAETAAVEGARASVKSSAAIVHAMALANSTASAAASTVDMEGAAITTVYGYPAVSGTLATLDLADAANLADFGLGYRLAAAVAADDTATSVIVFEGTNCFTYTEASFAAGPPAVITPAAVSGMLTYNAAVVPPTCS